MQQKSPHIVVVCQVFYPDAQSTSQLFTELLQSIASDGRARITVICGYPARVDGINDNLPRRETIGGVEIHRCGLRVDGKKSMAHRALAYFSFSGHALWKLLRLRRSDLVFGVTNPPFVGIILWLASLVVRFRYQYMFLDIYPEGLIASHLLRRNSPIAALWRTFNRMAYHRAMTLILLGRDMLKLLGPSYGLPANRFVYIPHWSVVETEGFHAVEGNRFIKEAELETKFVIQYSGNMGLWHDIDSFVRAAAELQDLPDVRFLFIGGGMRRQKAEALSRDLGVQNITWRKFVPLADLQESLAACHLSLVSLREGLSGIAVPCKIYGILASGRAMLAQVPADSEVALVVNEEQCGIQVDPGDSKSLVAAIRCLSDDRAKVAEMGRNAFRAYHQKYTLHQAKEAFLRLWGC